MFNTIFIGWQRYIPDQSDLVAANIAGWRCFYGTHSNRPGRSFGLLSGMKQRRWLDFFVLVPDDCVEGVNVLQSAEIEHENENR